MRRIAPVAAGCLVVAAAGLSAGCASESGPAPARPPDLSPARGPAPPRTGAYLGAYVNDDVADGQTRGEVSAFEAKIGRKLGVGHEYRPWTSRFELGSSEEAWHVENGRIPMISHGDTGHSGAQNILDAIKDGSQDELIRGQAREAKEFGHRFFYRPLWEMNGAWQPYNVTHASSPGTNDGTKKFVAAWRRIHRIWGEAGATNAAFVWCPNAVDSPRTAANHWTRYYPGDRYVDWVCADGYNRGSDQRWSRWRSFEDLFGRIYADFPQKPFMVGETSSSEHGGSKADWIRDAEAAITSRMPRVKAFLWFHRPISPEEPTSDWRVDTSAASLAAYRAVAANRYFAPRARP